MGVQESKIGRALWVGGEAFVALALANRGDLGRPYLTGGWELAMIVDD